MANGLTLSLPGGSLTTPMEDDAPTVAMHAVGANPSVLSWKKTQYELNYNAGDVFCTASVTFYSMLGDDHGGDRWQAVCAGSPGWLDAWFATAEEARAAVEEHIAAQVEQALDGGS